MPKLKAAKSLERFVTSDPDHPGVAHYMIHSYDYPAIAKHGVEAAKIYATIAPDSPHALHMPSHIYVRIARYGDAVRVNQDALAAEVRQTKKLEAQGFAHRCGGVGAQGHRRSMPVARRGLQGWCCSVATFTNTSLPRPSIRTALPPGQVCGPAMTRKFWFASAVETLL